ncbi:MAG: tRNA-guanine transglycosylase, partial [Acidimicrobiia bacterium]
LFDCVWPTRLARHGKVLTAFGDYSIRNAEHADSTKPLEEGCSCTVCATYGRGYLRHLVMTQEPSYLRLLTIHNLTYTLGLLRDVRRSITDGEFRGFQSATVQRRTSRKDAQGLP